MRRRSLSEIADETLAPDPYKPTNTPRIGSESTGTRATLRNATPEQVAANKRADADYAKGVARQVGQGVTFGFADEIEAGTRAALGPRDYRTVRDEIRGEDADFVRDNRGTALLANLAGGVLTGAGLAKAATKVPAIAAAGLAPKANAGATVAQRLGQVAKTGAVAGGISGAGVSEQDGTAILGDVALGAGVGAGIGTAFGAGAELFRAGRNLVSRVGQGQAPAGRIRQAIRADSPEQSAAKRVIQRTSNQNMTLDDLAARSAAADAPDVLGEVIGAKGVRDIRTARGLGYDAPDMIEQGLTTRARNDVGSVRQAVRRELGEQLDDKALPAEKLLEAQRAAGPLYEQALDGVTITDPRLVEWMKRPAIRDAYKTARRLAANEGVELPPSAAMVRGAQRAPDVADEVVGGVATNAARTEGGALRTVDKVSTADLVDELEALTTRQQRDMGQSMYNYVETDQRGGTYGVVRPVATRDPSGGPSMQAKAMRRVEQTDGVIDRITAELDRRGVDWTEAMARRAAGEADDFADDVARVVPGRGAVGVPDAADAPELPTLTGRQVQYLKHALDDKIAKLEGMRGGTATKEYAQLVKARTDVDGLLYEFANQGDDGASLWGAANKAYAKPMQEAEAFTEGVRQGRNIDAADVPRLLDGEQAAWRSRGVANTLQDDLGRLPRGDGDTRIANPASMLMGADAPDARLLVAAGGDAEKVARIQNVAGNVSRRLRTRNIVTGNSQTAEKLADMAEQGMNPGELIQGATSPVGLAVRAVGRGANALARNALGQDMDAMAKLLMAGAPGQMTRAEAVASLQRMEPFIRQQLMRQLVTRGAIGGAAGRAAAGPAR
jgi:hypothetical protein